MKEDKQLQKTAKTEIIQNRSSQLCEHKILCQSNDPFGQPILYTDTIVYNGCDIIVSYWVKKCLNPKLIQFYDVEIKPIYSEPCSWLKDEFGPQVWDWNPQFINEAYNKLYKYISIEIEEKYFFYRFNGVYSGWTAAFIKTGCYKLCVTTRNENWFSITSVRCGNSCCVRYTPYGNSSPSGPPIINGDPVCEIIISNCASGQSTDICNVACAGL